MTPTILTNLALSKIGHTLVKALGDTTSKEARLAALHYEPCLREALRAHFWSFAMTTRPLQPVDTREYLEITGPLKVGGTAVVFPRLHRKDTLVGGKFCYEETPEADSAAPVSSAFWDAAEAEWVLEHGPLEAQWRRGIDAASPELVTLKPHSPKHFLETNLEGGNNDLRFEQVEQDLPPVTVEYASPIPSGAISVITSARSIKIVPAIFGRMLIGGSLTGDATGILLPAGTRQGKPVWTSDGSIYQGAGNTWISGRTSLFFDIGRWHLQRETGAYGRDYYARNVSEANIPVGLTDWDIQIGTGAPVVTGLADTAAEAKAALEANATTADLVTVGFKAANNGTGAIALMPRVALAGGVTGVPGVRRVTPAAELSGWSHAFELPEDFVKARTLHSLDPRRRLDKFAIRRVAGKTCVLCNCEAVSLEYVQYLDDPAAFDPLFVRAFTTLLAAKLARAVSGSDDMEARFLQIFETVDLPAARTASGHETESSENHPLREILDGTLTPGRGDFFGRR